MPTSPCTGAPVLSRGPVRIISAGCSGAISDSGGTPVPITAAVYIGRALNPDGYTESQILTWTRMDKTGRFGLYPYPAGPGFICIALPSQFGAPSDLDLGEGFEIDTFPAAMGRPDGTPAYGIWENGYGNERPTVEGVAHRVYRSYYELNGQVDLQVF